MYSTDNLLFVISKMQTMTTKEGEIIHYQALKIM